MAEKSPDHSSGPILILLGILAVIAAFVSFFFYSRLWMMRSQNTSRPITMIITKPVNSAPQEEFEISVLTPAKNTQVISPIHISGSAPGTWYFEASFPVRLEDLQGNVLTQTYAQAVGEWMTEEQVDFTSTVEYSVNKETSAVLVFQPDDPAGFGVTEEYKHPILLLP